MIPRKPMSLLDVLNVQDVSFEPAPLELQGIGLLGATQNNFVSFQIDEEVSLHIFYQTSLF